MTLKDLSDQVLELKKKEYPSLPAHAIPRPKFSDKKANDLQNAILAFFKVRGIKAWRQSSEGRYIRERRETNILGQTIVLEKGRFIPRGKAGGKGAGDIQVVLPPYGRTLHVEVKIGKDRQRESQKEFQMELEGMGGIYMIVKTWDNFYEQIRLYLKI